MESLTTALYFSATGTTAKIVKQVANGLGGELKEYNITLPIEREKNIEFTSDDMVIVGVPVYAGRVPAFLTEYFKKVKGHNTPVILIVLYGNRAYDDALIELKEAFEQNGFIAIAGASFIGEHSYTRRVATGRPDEKDLELAKQFGVKIRKSVEAIQNINQMAKLVVKGESPYKERKSLPPMAPETDEKCIRCGICAKNCPSAAIDFDDFKEIDVTKCILCFSCVKKCPVEAKSVTNQVFLNFTQGLIDRLAEDRQEPEIFMV